MRAGKQVDFLDGIMGPAAWPKAVARSLEPGFPLRLQRVLDQRLPAGDLAGAVVRHRASGEFPGFVEVRVVGARLVR